MTALSWCLQQPGDEQGKTDQPVCGLEEKMTTIVGLKRSINAPLVYHPAGIYITVFKETLWSHQTEQHLLSMMRTNLLPPLQTHSLSEMKGKLCYCNSSKWPAPAALHAATAIDLYSLQLSRCVCLCFSSFFFSTLYGKASATGPGLSLESCSCKLKPKRLYYRKVSTEDLQSYCFIIRWDSVWNWLFYFLSQQSCM